MNFLKSISTRWPEEEIKKWTSIQKTAYILLPLLLYLVVHDLAEFLLWAVMELLISNSNAEAVHFMENNSYTLQGMINGLAIIAGVAAIRSAVTAELEAAENQGKASARDFILLAVLAFGAAVGFNILFSLLGVTASSDTYSGIARQQYGVNFWIGLVLYGVFSPFAEEAVFRCLIYNRLKRSFGTIVGLVVSSLLFGLYHGNPVQAVYGMILGLLIAYTYEKYRTFVIPVLFHSVANICVYTLTYSNSFRTMKAFASITITIVLLTIAASILLIISKRNTAIEKK